MNKLKMSLIIVSDIFGHTPALQKFSETLGRSIELVEIIDPYDGKIMDFNDEQDAYNYFTKHIGLTAYTEKLQLTINACTEKTVLLGFSIGASAIWQLSKNSNNLKVQAAIGFYGSQIRHQLEIIPTFPVELIFPKSEPHFCVTHLMDELKGKQPLTLIQVDYLHGFMNKHSSNYHQQAYQYYCDWLINKIKTLKIKMNKG